MSTERQKRHRLANATAESLRILGSLLNAYYAGDATLYIPMSAQLRIHLCDTRRGKENSLYGRLVPDLKIRAFQVIEGAQHGPLEVGFLPFEITETDAGVVFADFDLSDPPRYISLKEWRHQVVTRIPTQLTVEQIIRSVCDKGGGAHVDDDDGFELSAMRQSGPTKAGIQIPFILATARFSFNLGRELINKNARDWGLIRQDMVKDLNRSMADEHG